MKAVYDTNIFISAFLWKGKPYRCLLLAKTKLVDLYVCGEILTELEEKLIEKFDFKEKEAKMIIEQITPFSKKVLIKGTLKAIKEDADDDKFIECAINSKADYIVSGDKHLLNIKSYKGIRILNASDFLHEIKREDK